MNNINFMQFLKIIGDIWLIGLVQAYSQVSHWVFNSVGLSLGSNSKESPENNVLIDPLVPSKNHEQKQHNWLYNGCISHYHSFFFGP